MKLCSLSERVSICTPNLFYEDKPRTEPIRLFWVKLLTILCKLDHYIIENIFYIALKRSSLSKRVSICTPKLFYESKPRTDPIRLFGVKSLTILCKLDHYIIENIFYMTLKRSSLQKRMSKFIPNKFSMIKPMQARPFYNWKHLFNHSWNGLA